MDTPSPNPCAARNSYPGFSVSRLCLYDSYAQGTRCWPGSVRTESLLLLGLSSVEAVFLTQSLILLTPSLAWISSLCCFPPQPATCGQVSTSKWNLASECQPLLVEQQLEKKTTTCYGKRGRTFLLALSGDLSASLRCL